MESVLVLIEVAQNDFRVMGALGIGVGLGELDQ